VKGLTNGRRLVSPRAGRVDAFAAVFAQSMIKRAMNDLLGPFLHSRRLDHVDSDCAVRWLTAMP
jgi:hypothetical protein